MFTPNSAHIHPPSRLSAVLAASYLGFAAFFVAGRVGAYGPNHGDVAIWIPMHEWMSRGAVLYDAVWDHKDWGFFWLSQPFYRLMGIEGLYLVGFLSVVALGFGVYLSIRACTSGPSAVAVASTAAMIYVSAPSFWSIFTENLSIGLVVLAIGLSFRTPMVGGFIWALSTSVKIAGAGLLVAVLVTMLASVGLAGASIDRRTLLRCLARLVAGFVGGSVFIVAASFLTGSLLGWIYAFEYNREYSQGRGFPPRWSYSGDSWSRHAGGPRRRSRTW